MKRRLSSEESRLQRDSNPRPRDPKSGALTARPRGRFRTVYKNLKHMIVTFDLQTVDY